MANVGELAARYEAVVREKRTTEERLRQLTALADGLEQEMVDAMTDAGLQSVATATATIYLADEVWARPVPDTVDRLIDLLDDLDLGDIAQRRVNTHSLSAVVREAIRDAGEPPAWATPDLVTIDRRWRARLRAK